MKWGPQTFDEMMIGYIEYYTSGKSGGLPAVNVETPNLEAVFKRLDRDQDGKLSGDELPADWKERLLKLDADGDKSVSLDEVQKGLRRLRPR